MVFNNCPSDFNPKFEVVGCYCERDSKILLLKRPKDKPQPNTWNIPGGKIELGETPLQAVIRETKEETGIELPAGAVTLKGKYFVKYKDYDYVYYTFHSFVEGYEVKLQKEESEEYGWFVPQEALKLPLLDDEDICLKNAYKIQ